jgi:hypothetical protein
MDAAGEGDEHAEPGGLVRRRDRHGVEQVGRAVGAGRAGGAHRAGEHDGRIARVEEIGEEGDLLERVRPVGDHDAASSVRLDLRGAGEGERAGRVELHARAGVDGVRGEVREAREVRHGGDERGGIEARRGGRAAGRRRHGDGPTRREHGDRPGSSRGHGA